MSVAVATLTGRREGALLDLPSVRHMADLLAARCRERSWVRTSVASLDRFRVLTDSQDLEGLLGQSRGDVSVAERALAAFQQALGSFADSQIAALAMGPKLWFRLNGVPVPWVCLRPSDSAPPPDDVEGPTLDRMVLLALIGSGLQLAELLRLRVGDIGSLDADGRLAPDRAADPLAVRYTTRRGKQREYITFLSFQARQALQASFRQRTTAGQALEHDAPLFARSNGTAATAGSVAYARRRNQALIQAGNQVNVTMCRATGEFFRNWGMPGARFTARQQAEEVEAL